jgi:hypothetical protein
MTSADQTPAIEGIRRFFKLHATCGGIALDTPELPNGVGYRAVAACRCGDTAEYWLVDAFLSRQQLVSAVTPRAMA